MKLVSLKFLVHIRRHLNILTRNGKMETQAKLLVLPIYVENRGIVEPIFLYRASNCKKKIKSMAAITVYGSIFLP